MTLLLKLSTMLWVAGGPFSMTPRSPYKLGLDFLHAPKQETLTAALVQEDSSAGEMGEHLTFFP